MKVDVGDQGDADLLLDLGHRLGRFHIGNRRADNLAAGFFKLVDLAHRGLHVSGVGFGHGLDGNVRIAAHFDAAHIYGLSDSPPGIRHNQHRRSKG